MSDILFSLWPLFVLIVVGHIMQRSGFPGAGFWPGAERFNYFVLFPALLFSSLSGAPLNNPALPRLLVVLVVVLGVVTAGLLAARRIRQWPAARFGVQLQGLLRFNTYLGIAAVSGLYGKEGMVFAAVILAVLVPAVNVLSVLALSADRSRSVRSLLVPVIKNPLILACLAGALFNLSGLELKWGTDRLLTLLANTSLPLGLLCVGAALKLEELRGQGAALLGNSLVRLLAVPAVAFLSAWLLGLPEIETVVVVVFFALPTAPSAYVLTRQLGGDSHLMAGLITFQTLLSAVTLLLVMAALAQIHAP
ncbi:AEC family transporter [Thauera sp.]|uniref:AEC family transporter n=1 Tax=Thauera sp. TaxID=1905334 RepID=UPI0039E3CB93